MKKLEKLIQEFCPNGVPFKKVKNVYTRLKGTPITAGKMKKIACEGGEIRVFAGGKTSMNFTGINSYLLISAQDLKDLVILAI